VGKGLRCFSCWNRDEPVNREADGGFAIDHRVMFAAGERKGGVNCGDYIFGGSEGKG